jgi:DNA-binding LacI/PurR family transcriptional regulator
MPDTTIYDVAKKAKVSIATVSRVLNSPEKVSEATRNRVLAAIDSLGFVPKAEAAARARKNNGRIGVLAPFFVYPSFVQRLRGVAAALAYSPYDLMIYYVDSSARRDAILASLSVTRRVDGLIVMALPFGDTAGQRLLKHGIETVLIEVARPSFSSIEIDDEGGGRMAAEYLISKGHRRCAFVGDKDLPDYSIHTSDRRLLGYRQALASAGIPLPDAHVSLAPQSIENARQQTHLLLDLPEPPTAIFAASDTQAMGVLKAAHERGVSIPNQLAIIGFDDLDISDYIGLTTVRQCLEESGRVAVELLLARLTDPSRAVQHIKLPLCVVQRQTA